MRTLDDILKQIEAFPLEQVFVTDAVTGTKYTYGDIYRQADRIGLWLQAQGYSELIVCMENGVELLTVYFAALLYQIVVIPVDPAKSRDEIGAIREIHSQAFYMDGTLPSQPLSDYEEGTKHDFSNAAYDKPFLITYTSGSTGTPKGVKHSAKNLFLAAASFGEAMHYGRHTVLAHVMPMTYMAGILNSIFLPFVMGGQIVVFPGFNMKSAMGFWKTAVKYQVNTFWLSPTMLRILDIIDAKGAYRDYLHEVHAVISVGTAPLYPDLREKFENKYAIRIYQSYGLSETLFLTSEPPEDEKSRNSVGKLLPGVRLVLADDGEIQVAVPWMFSGYADKQIPDNISNHYYLTGDLGYLQDEYLFINGRKKDLIIRGGFNINPCDIEKRLQGLDEIDENVVLSCVLHGEEQIVCCYTGKQQDIHLLNGLLEKELGRHYKLDHLIRLKEIPKNLNGKADKPKIREMLKENDYEA